MEGGGIAAARPSIGQTDKTHQIVIQYFKDHFKFQSEFAFNVILSYNM